MTTIVGIDIAKDKFDVCLLNEAGKVQEASFANSKQGINQLHHWLKKTGGEAGPGVLGSDWHLRRSGRRNAA